MSAPPNPSHIMQIGAGFWASKTLLTAIEFGVFTLLAERPMTGRELEASLEMHPRATFDFLDTLVALGFLEREGDGEAARYSNAPDTDLFLDRNKPEYMGGILEMFNARLYRYWDDLGVALRTGMPQNEIKETGQSIFAELYKDEAGLEGFMNAMSGISAGNFAAFARTFDFSGYTTMCDVGGATGQLCTLVARENAHLKLTTFDLPPVAPIASRHIHAAGLDDRIDVVSGDFFADPLPAADVITMGMILHDWNLEKKMQLIRAAHDALPDGGCLVAIENIIDDARRENAFGLMMSLNMLIEFGDAFDFTASDFQTWCTEAGFSRFETIPLGGPAAAVVAYK